MNHKSQTTPTILTQHYFWLLLFLLTSLPVGSHEAVTINKDSRAIEKALLELPSKGVLKQGPDGYVYLKLPDRYVTPFSL